jgi:single-stranded-DNA-specific exonuclease
MTKQIEQTRERWHLASVQTDEVKALSDALGIEFLLAKILLARNIGNGDVKTVNLFLNPPEELLTDYSGVTSAVELEKAVERISRAIKKREKIVVNGDPDADGISGACILVSGLEALGADVSYNFPVRCREGHGLQVRIVDEAKTAGASLIITTDCGSKDISAAAYAKEQGLDVIVTDHHILGKELPDVYAFVNPNMVEEDTHFKTLAGAGVAYKVMLATFDKMGQVLPNSLNDFMLAVSTLGTLSDRMSLLNPMNRIMVLKGVDAIKRTHWEGLKAIKKVCRVDDKTLRPRQLSRSIIPRLNAPGRIGDPSQGIPDSTLVVDLLLTGAGAENAEKAATLSQIFMDIVNLEKEKKSEQEKNDMKREALSSAASVDDINEQRKFMTNKIEEEIEALVDEQVDLKKEHIVIVQGKNWNSGVIGIDTDRLKERYLRPAVIITKYDHSDYVRGSVRSIPNINMYAIVDKANDLFEEKHGCQLFKMEVLSSDGEAQVVNAFGGHAQACGFSMHYKDVPEFIELVREQEKKIPEDKWGYHYDIIAKLPISQVGPKLLSQLDKLGPYGQRFEFPTFYLQGCLLSTGTAFGNKYQEFHKPHVNFKVIENQAKKTNMPPREFEAVGFGLWEKFCSMRSNLDPNMKFDVIFTIEQDQKRRGKQKGVNIRLNVLDIRQSGDNVDSFMEPASTNDELF